MKFLLIHITYRHWTVSIPARIQNSRVPIDSVFVSTTMIISYYFCGDFINIRCQSDSFNEWLLAMWRNGAHSSVINFGHVKCERVVHISFKYVMHINKRCIQFEIYVLLLKYVELISNWHLHNLSKLSIPLPEGDLFLRTLWKNFTIIFHCRRAASIKFM